MTSPMPIASRGEGPGDDGAYDPHGADDAHDAYDMRDFETYAAVRWSRLVRTAYLLTNGDHHEAEDL
ncbi:hypothetical protein ACIHIX_36445, partial [Streptomyces sp. NPDC051913]